MCGQNEVWAVNNSTQPHTKGLKKTTGVLRVVQQQHYRIELLSGSIVSAQGDDEVIEAVSCCLRRHDNQLILKAVGLGILEAAVRAALSVKMFGRC